MLRQRLIVAILLVPPGVACIALGGVWYFGVLLLFFLPAAYEYSQMMRRGGHRPAMPLVIGGVFLLLLAHAAPTFWPSLGPNASSLITSGALMLMLALATTWHLIDYERGNDSAGTDWAITVAGLVYLGWMGGYFLLLRALPDGKWWTLIVLPAVWLSDSGAYTIGSRFGKHRLAPRLSPKKTWEGFGGGIAWGIFFGGLFGGIWSIAAPPESIAGIGSGAAIGFFVAFVGTIGDLGISMLKRQIGVKDTGSILGAHGGMLDRIDSWLIAVPLAYFFILLFFQ